MYNIRSKKASLPKEKLRELYSKHTDKYDY